MVEAASDREMVVDLKRFAATLPAEHKAFRQQLRDALDLYSAHTDLRLAAEWAARSIEFDEGAYDVPERVREDCSMACLNSAIVYYGRATKSDSDHRKTFDIRSLFDRDERESHELICQLRDDAVAHYGPGELPDGIDLRDDLVLFSLGPGQLVFASRNVTSSKPLANIIQAQAQRAMLVVQRLQEGRQDRLVQAIEALPGGDPEIDRAWAAAVRNMAAAMGDAKAATAVIEGPGVGTHRITGKASPKAPD